MLLKIPSSPRVPDSVRAARRSLLGYDRDVCGRCGPGVDAAVEDRRRDLGYV